MKDSTNSIDTIIYNMFHAYWYGDHTLKNIDNMKKQLHKNLTDQLNGYWSGSSAYQIMTKGGFLVDSKRGSKKELTALGHLFMKEYKDKVKK